MKLAISNIAWRKEEQDHVASLMTSAGVTGVELAPTAVWPEPLRAKTADIHAVRSWWHDRGITVVALQALLFGKPELTVFGSEASRRATLDHLTGMMDLAAELGAQPLVFGSPKNRLVGDLSPEAVQTIAGGFFAEAAQRAFDRGVVLCIEPNPAAYGCDFVRTTAEAVALVEDVDSPGFMVHMDAGALKLNEEPLPATILRAGANICHFHASEPQLVPLGEGGADHAACARALRTLNYQGWVSVEMRATPDAAANLPRVLTLLSESYGA